MTDQWKPPAVQDPSRVSSYPARAFAGGGYLWDAVLEYRVWCHPHDGAPHRASSPLMASKRIMHKRYSYSPGRSPSA